MMEDVLPPAKRITGRDSNRTDSVLLNSEAERLQGWYPDEVSS